MEDTESGASAFVHDSLHQTDQWKFQHYTDGDMVHSQADQLELNQVVPSGGLDKPRARGCKNKLSEAQKRENKRQSDVKYRLKKKTEVNEMSAQNKSLQEQIGWLSTENKHLKEETGRLTAENSRLEELIRQVESEGKLPAEVLLQCKGNPAPQSTSQNKYLLEEIQKLSAENKHLKEETGQLTTENRHLKEEAERLTTENRHLEDHIGKLQSKMKLPAENVQMPIKKNSATQKYLDIVAENSLQRTRAYHMEDFGGGHPFLCETGLDAFDAEFFVPDCDD